VNLRIKERSPLGRTGHSSARIKPRRLTLHVSLACFEALSGSDRPICHDKKKVWHEEHHRSCSSVVTGTPAGARASHGEAMYLKQLNVPATVALPSGKRHRNPCTSRIYWRPQQRFEYIIMDLGKKEQTKQGKEPSAMTTRASRPQHITPEILSDQMITDEKIASQC
jgi:hypothetical protein